jgi:hypothetical protein
MDLSVEDLQEHGRLLLLKQKLVSMVDVNDKLDIKTLGMFQLKDFCRSDEVKEQALCSNLDVAQLTSKDAIDAMDYRQ